MALTSTMYHFTIELSDTDRSVYETLKCTVAMHPSESLEYMAVRILAYCLEYEEGLVFTKGLSEGEEPALWQKHLDGRIKLWLEIGSPHPDRIHKAAKATDRVVIYTHKNPLSVLRQFDGKRVHRGEDIPLYSFEPEFLREFSEIIDRRNSLEVSVTGRVLYLALGGKTLSSNITERRLANA